MMSIYYAQCVLLCSLILLLCSREIRSSTEWEGQASEQRSQSYSILVWGHKRARTARYEVPFQSLKQIESAKSEARCEICRPNCPHWCRLDKKEKNKAYVRFYRKKQTKEERQIRLAKQNHSQKQYYANLSQMEKDKRKKASVQSRRVRLAIMTPEQKKAFYKKNRGKNQ